MGAHRAARFLVAIARDTPDGTDVRQVNLNGQPGLVALYRGVAVSAVVLDIAEGLVSGVRVVANPDKLTAVNVALTEGQGANTSTAREEGITWRTKEQKS